MEYPNNGIGDNEKTIDQVSNAVIETFESLLNNADSIDMIELALEEIYEAVGAQGEKS